MSIFARPYRKEDFPAIFRMHREMGFDYRLPNLQKTVSCVIEVDGEPQMAGFLRKTAETYLLMHRDAPKRDQLGRLLILHQELAAPARRAGFDDIHAWLPPEIDKPFGRLLLHLGWTKPLWPSYSRKVE
jgi:hypothetical protein